MDGLLDQRTKLYIFFNFV